MVKSIKIFTITKKKRKNLESKSTFPQIDLIKFPLLFNNQIQDNTQSIMYSNDNFLFPKYLNSSKFPSLFNTLDKNLNDSGFLEPNYSEKVKKELFKNPASNNKEDNIIPSNQVANLKYTIKKGRYYCRDCGKSYSRIDAFKRHYNPNHNGNRGEECPFCFRKFYRFKVHMNFCRLLHKNKKLFRKKIKFKKNVYKNRNICFNKKDKEI